MSIIRYNTNEYVPTTFSNLVDKFFNESLARSGGSPLHRNTLRIIQSLFLIA